jgi:hypothetical protein
VAIDATHPGCFRTSEGLFVTREDPRIASDAWHARRRAERRRDGMGCAAMLLGAGLGIAATVYLVRGVLGSQTGLVYLYIWIGALLGAALMDRVGKAIVGSGEIAARRPDARRVPDVLARSAPPETPVDRLIAWIDTLTTYETVSSRLRTAREHVGMSDGEKYVAPGDRSTWFYDAASLPGLEDDYARARASYVALTRELGLDAGESLLDDRSGDGR